MHEQLRERVRLVAGRNRLPTAAIIDSQSVKAAEEVARTGRRYDAGEKVNGPKRHIAVDVMGMLLTVLVTATSVQDRDAARPLLWNLRQAFPKIKLAWITRHRRTVRDYERLPAHHETYVYRSMIIVMTRRLARKPAPAGTSAQPQAA